MQMPESKEERLQHIREVVALREVGNQQELVTALAARGVVCTQSSVSRDLADLGVLKRDGRYVLPESDRVRALGIIKALPAGPNLMVLRTETGAAPLIALHIDHLGLPQVVGTIAGDDTIFIATPSVSAQAELASVLGVSA
jgi:transcriptional regulator of arginine metabolism